MTAATATPDRRTCSSKPVIRSATESGGTVSVDFRPRRPRQRRRLPCRVLHQPGRHQPSGQLRGRAVRNRRDRRTRNGPHRASPAPSATSSPPPPPASTPAPPPATRRPRRSRPSESSATPEPGLCGVGPVRARPSPAATRGAPSVLTVATASVGEFRVMQAAEAPQRDETIVVGVASSGTIAGEMWNGSSWSALPPLGEHERDVLVERRGRVPESEQRRRGRLHGRRRPELPGVGRTNWSPEAAIAEPTAGTPRQLRLAGDRESDELVLIVSDDASRDYAIVWNGSAWGNAVLLDGAGTGNDRTDISVVYEHQSGDVLVVLGKGTNNVSYRTWNGTVWSSEAVLTGIAGGYAVLDHPGGRPRQRPDRAGCRNERQRRLARRLERQYVDRPDDGHAHHGRGRTTPPSWWASSRSRARRSPPTARRPPRRGIGPGRTGPAGLRSSRRLRSVRCPTARRLSDLRQVMP